MDENTGLLNKIKIELENAAAGRKQGIKCQQV